MIIWNGLGFLGALIPFVIIVTMNSTLGTDTLGWSLLTSAVPLWILGRNFHARPAKMMLDPKTRQNILVKPEHTLFWVDLEYWAIIFGLLGIAELTSNMSNGVSMSIASVLVGIIFIGRLSFSLYHKYFKKEDSENTQASSQSPAGPNDNKEDKLSTFAKKSRTKKKLGGTPSLAEATNKDSGLPESELKKKAFYAKMRETRETPKKFGASDHSKYFPGTIRAIPTTMEVEEEIEIAFEEE